MIVLVTYGEAKADIQKHFNDFWLDAIANGLNGKPAITFTPQNDPTTYVPEIDWQNIEQQELNDIGKHWCRFSILNNSRSQRTLTDPTMGTKFETQGILICQLYLSKTAYTTEQHDRLAAICESAFTKKQTNLGVWFRNAIIDDLSPTENYFRCNVTAEYIFDSTVI